MNGSNFSPIVVDGSANPAATMNNHGALYQGFIRTTAGAAPEASDNDQVVASFVPVAGGWTPMTLLADPDVPRTLLLTVVDANSSMKALCVRVFGTDQFGNKCKEIFRSTGGSKTLAGKIAFRTISKAEYKVGGVVTAINDTIKLGTTNVLGMPVAFFSPGDVCCMIVDGTTADAGTLNSEFHTWLPEGGNLPNGAKTFEVEIRSTRKPRIVQNTFSSILG